MGRYLCLHNYCALLNQSETFFISSEPLQQQPGGYPPPQGGYPPPQGGYPPPQDAGYPPPQGGYPPPQQQGYPPPQAPGGPPVPPGLPGVMPAGQQAPSNCPPGLEYLTQIDQLLVHQQVELLEGKIL